jgi:hypothetical protein
LYKNYPFLVLFGINFVLKNKISKLKKDKFLECLKEIKNKIDSNPESNDLSDIFNDNSEIRKIRKRLLNSKFKYLIKDKYLRVIKSKEFYGNNSKIIKINDDIYLSIAEASENLKIDRSLIRYRLKSNNFKNYTYLD